MKTLAGRINKLFGTGGGVWLSLYDAFPQDFDPASTPLLVRIDGLEVPLWCERFSRRGTSGAVAELADLDTQRRAQEVVGLEFSLDLPQAEVIDMFEWEQIVGFAVETVEFPPEGGKPRHRRGKLAAYIDNDANPLFEIDLDGRRVLVPAVEEFIARIDFDARLLRLAVPGGLLDLE